MFLFAGLYVTGGTFIALLSARAIYGLLAGRIQPGATAWVARHTLRDRRAAGVALVGAAVGIASIAGSDLAAGEIGFGLAVPVVLGSALAALAAVTTLFGVRAGRPNARPSVPAAAIDGLTPYLLVSFAMVVAFGALQPTTALFVQDRFGFATAEAIRQASLASAGFATSTFVVQAFVVRRLPWLPHRLLAIGLVICLVAIGVGLVAPAAEVLIMAYGLLGIGYGLAQAGLTAGASILGGKHRQGQVAGRMQAAMSAAWIVGALGGTALYPLSVLAPLLVAGAAMMLAVGLAYAGVSPATSQI